MTSPQRPPVPVKVPSRFMRRRGLGGLTPVSAGFGLLIAVTVLLTVSAFTKTVPQQVQFNQAGALTTFVHSLDDQRFSCLDTLQKTQSVLGKVEPTFFDHPRLNQIAHLISVATPQCGGLLSKLKSGVVNVEGPSSFSSLRPFKKQMEQWLHQNLSVTMPDLSQFVRTPSNSSWVTFMIASQQSDIDGQKLFNDVNTAVYYAALSKPVLFDVPLWSVTPLK